MTTTPERDLHDLALLLDLPDGSAARTAVERRLATDAHFRAAYEELHEMATSLESLGHALHARAGVIDIVSDVEDALSHAAWEGRSGSERPFHDVEQPLEALSDAWNAAAPDVDLVAAVLDDARIMERTDSEVELPYGSVTSLLNELGDAFAASAPEVDLAGAVMDRVRSTERAAENVVPLRPQVSAAREISVPGRIPWRRYAALAAAAAVVVGTGTWYAFQPFGGPTTPPVELARTDPEGREAPTSKAPEPHFERVVPSMPEPAPLDPGATPEPVSPESPAKSEAANAITLQEAINARRRALVDGAAAFERLASLSAEEASRMLQEMDLSLEALIGAAQFLSREDAAAVLRAAVANEPENESLRYALARSLAGNPEAAEERQAQLEELAALDESNTLPHYMLAADYMARGDVEQGMDALSRGAIGAEADIYTLESMRQREAVLLASGLDADVARYLAVSTGGESQVSDIASLRSELLDYGAYYEQHGDMDTAQQIYNAVNQLGAQITDGAEMAAIRRAGLETQQEAIYAIQGIAEILQQPENVRLLGNTLSVLAESILEATEYVNAAQAVIDDPGATSTDWSTLIQHILNDGDTDIANLMRQ